MISNISFIRVSKRNRPFEGRVLLGRWSSIRKLARAIRRDKVSPEWQQVMNIAIESATKRGKVYGNSAQKGR